MLAVRSSADDFSGHKDEFRDYQKASLNLNLMPLFCYKERIHYAVLKHQKEDSMSEHFFNGWIYLKHAKLYNNVIVGRISFGSERHHWQSGCL